MMKKLSEILPSLWEKEAPKPLEQDKYKST